MLAATAARILHSAAVCGVFTSIWQSEASVDDSIDINLRPRRQIAHRLLIEVALTNRAGLESLDRYTTDDEEARFDLVAWLIDARAVDELTRFERGVLEAPLGALTPDNVDRLAFSLEAAHSLAWSLALIESEPAPPEPIDGGAVLAAVPAPDDDTGEFLNRLTLRSLEEIAAHREAAEIWLWRLGIERERRDASAFDRREADEVIAETAQEAVDAGLLVETTGDDFPLFGQAVRNLSPDQLDFATLIAETRLTAFNWICGYGASWEDVPLEVE
jgi:hypothetical protein